MAVRSTNIVELTDALITDATYQGPDKPPYTYIIRDSLLPNFACRVSRTGLKTFIYFYRDHDGTQKNATLGRFNDPIDSITTEAAREKAKEIKRSLKPSTRATDATTLKAPAPWKQQKAQLDVVSFIGVLERFSSSLTAQEETAQDEADGQTIRMRNELLTEIIGLFKDACMNEQRS